MLVRTTDESLAWPYHRPNRVSSDEETECDELPSAGRAAPSLRNRHDRDLCRRGRKLILYRDDRHVRSTPRLLEEDVESLPSRSTLFA